MRLFGEITKIEDQADGSLKVFGVASTGARDDDGEIVSPAAMKAALPDYARYPALREMHQPSAAGRTLEAEVDDDGVTHIVAQVVDPVAIAKVRSRTYSGFSIGGRVLERDPTDRTVITRIKLSEISLVDRPANPEAVIDLWKADDIARPPAASPANDAVKARAAEMAGAAGRAGAWKDYVAKARAVLVAELAKGAASDDDDDENDDGDDGDGGAANASDSDEAGSDDAPAADDDGAEDDDEAADTSDDTNVASALGDLITLAAADPDTLQAAHDALAALGAACDPDNCPMDKHAAPHRPSPPAEDTLAKALPLIDALSRRLDAHAEALDALARQPLPPKTAASVHARPIGKADDTPDHPADAALTPAEAQKAFAALGAEERAFLLMKASLRQPIPVL